MKRPPPYLSVPRLAAILAVAASGILPSLPAMAFELVSHAEMEQEIRDGKPPKIRTRSVPDQNAPNVDLVLPVKLDGVKAPFPVELRFSAKAGAQIDPASFKVSYGFLGIDLTERIRKAAAVRADGIRAEKVEIPPGSHRLTVRITDSAQRVGEREIRLTVVE